MLLLHNCINLNDKQININCGCMMLSLQSPSLHHTNMRTPTHPFTHTDTYVLHPLTCSTVPFCSATMKKWNPLITLPPMAAMLLPRHSQQLRTSYYLTTWLPVISGTTGILSAVELKCENALSHTHMHTIVHYQPLHTSRAPESVHSQPFQTPSSGLSTGAYRWCH